MPLSKGHSKKAISRNIATLMREYDCDGHIAGYWPPSRMKATQQAVAIALQKAKAMRTRPWARSSVQPRTPLHV